MRFVLEMELLYSSASFSSSSSWSLSLHSHCSSEGLVISSHAINFASIFSKPCRGKDSREDFEVEF